VENDKKHQIKGGKRKRGPRWKNWFWEGQLKGQNHKKAKNPTTNMKGRGKKKLLGAQRRKFPPSDAKVGVKGEDNRGSLNRGCFLGQQSSQEKKTPKNPPGGGGKWFFSMPQGGGFQPPPGQKRLKNKNRQREEKAPQKPPYKNLLQMFLKRVCVKGNTGPLYEKVGEKANRGNP